MDDLDFRLLSHLHRDALASHATLGRALDMSGTAAGRRVEALRARDVLRGFLALPAAPVFRRHERVLVYQGGRWSEEDARAALEAPDVVWVAEKHDGDLTVQTYSTSPDASAPEALRARLRADPVRMVTAQDPAAFPVLSPLDWRIMEAVVEEPRASVDALAFRTHLSPKTVRRRRGDLLARGWLRIFPLLGPLRGEGVMLFHVGVYSDRPLDEGALRRAVPDAVVVNRLQAPPAAYLFCRAPDLAGVAAVQEVLRALPGVRDVQLSLQQQQHVNTARVLAWVRAERARWDDARKAGATGP